MSTKNSADFITRLGEMMSKGFSIGEAIDFLMINIPGINKKQLTSIHESLQSGLPLSDILFILHIPSFICLQIYFAEKHGNVQSTLVQAGNQWKKSEQAKEKLIKLLQYPIFLLVLLAMLLTILNTFVLPQFRDLHSSMGYEPKGIIVILLFFLEWAPPIALVAIPSAISAGLFLLARYKLLSPRKKAGLLSSIPYVKTFFQLYFTRLFARETAHLLNSGFPVNAILNIFEQQTIYPILCAASQSISMQLVEGETLQGAIEKIPWFDRKLASLIGHGSTNGRLAEELFLYAEFCNEIIEEKIKKITGLIQPVVFLFIGMIVMAVYLSVMLPMFEMIGSV